MTDAEPTTLAEISADAARRNTESLATGLEQLAVRLRRTAVEFTDGTSTTASNVAAEIVSNFTGGVGQLGNKLWGVVHNAGMADAARARDRAVK